MNLDFDYEDLRVISKIIDVFKNRLFYCITEDDIIRMLRIQVICDNKLVE